MYQAARQQFLRGSLVTARRGMQAYLQAWPQDAQVPDALYYVGEAFRPEAPDSAAAYYGQVIARFPRSDRAPTALYKLGRLEEDRKNPAAARAWYLRLIRDYPASQDADLARDQLKQLRP
jgi:tol-pal system protein YbgF